MNISVTPQQLRRNSSFFYPMLLLPSAKRRAMLALYDFCRAADDAADEAPSAEAAMQGVRFWQDELTRIYTATPTHPIGHALADACITFTLPRRYFDDMLEGLLLDITAPCQAPSYVAFNEYCYRVAGTVGLLSMHIFGVHGKQAEDFARCLGHALQGTNILRDIAEDAARGRCYLPAEILSSAGIATGDFSLTHPALQHAWNLLAKDVMHAYCEADKLSRQLPSRKILPALLMRDAYRLVLERLSAMPIAQHVNDRLPARKKIGLAVNALRYAL